MMAATLWLDLALLVGGSLVLSVIAKATIVCVAALAIAMLCRHGRASQRHMIFAAVFAVLLLLPFASLVAPRLIVEPPAFPPASAATVYSPAAPDTSAPGAASTMAAPALSTARTPARFAEALIAGWLLGMLAFAAPVAIGLWQLHRIRCGSMGWPDGQTLLDRLAADRGLGAIALLCHDGVSGPLTCGVLRPAIIVPGDVRAWSVDQLRRALVHELEHVRRRDWATHCVSRTVCAAYWFHPLVWIVWRRLVLEAERACDDAVVAREDAAEYASLLVSVAQRQLARPRQPMLAMAGRGDLSIRVSAVLDRTQARGAVSARRVAATIVAALLAAAIISPLVTTAQPQQEALRFDVASIRPNTAGRREIRIDTLPGGRFIATNVPVRSLIRIAYGVADFQIVGGPAWIDDDRFDVLATSSRDLPPMGGPLDGPADLRPMLRSLLEERFGLTVHTETRQLPTFTLVTLNPGRTGRRLSASAIDCAALFAQRAADGDRPACGLRIAPGSIVLEGVPISQLASVLSEFIRRVVIDKTGLTGPYNLQLSWQMPQPPRSGAPDAVPAAPERPGLFTALEEQAGLRLERQTGPVEVLVIDRLEPPTEN